MDPCSSPTIQIPELLTPLKPSSLQEFFALKLFCQCMYVEGLVNPDTAVSNTPVTTTGTDSDVTYSWVVLQIYIDQCQV